MIETKKTLNPAILAVVIVLVVGLIGFIAFRSLRGGDNGSAAGGVGATVTAPTVQRYSDGTVVPYNAAPTGATPGNPASARR